MKENETSSKKSPVKFDESKNIVKEFAKNERIVPYQSKKVIEDETPLKIAKTEEASPEIPAQPEPSQEKAAEKPNINDTVASLQKSSVVIKARDEMMLKEAPKNFYQFERDIKSFKDDKDKKLKYIKNIQPDDVKSIFKSDLEADTMHDIFQTFSEQDDQFMKDNQKYLIDFVAAIQSVKPFDLSCEFLMDDEKDKIRDFMNKLDESDPTLIKIKQKFTSVGQIDF